MTGKPPVKVLGYATAQAVAASNRTYRDNYCDILGISPDDEFPFAMGPSGFVYAGWLPDQEFLRKVYEDVIDHSLTETAGMNYRQHLLALAASFIEMASSARTNVTPQKLLDFGCGYGALLQILASSDINCIGYEPSAQRSAHTTAGGRFPVVSEPDRLAEMGPFDLIVCTEVLEHVPDPRKVLALLRESAVPGALMAITVPQCERGTIECALTRLFQEGQVSKVFNPWEHLNYFSAVSLRNLLSEEGFKVIRDHGAAITACQGFLRLKDEGASHVRNAARLLKTLAAPVQSTQLFCQRL